MLQILGIFFDMKVNNIDSFVGNPNTVRGALFYGDNSGKIKIYRDKIVYLITQNNLFLIDEFEFSRVNSDPDILNEALYIISQKRVILINQATEKLSSALKLLITEYSGDAYIIFSAGVLSPRSTLRQYFEASKSLASIPFYNDEGSALAR